MITKILLVLSLQVFAAEVSHGPNSQSGNRTVSENQIPIIACEVKEENSQDAAHTFREIFIEQVEKKIKIRSTNVVAVTDKESAKTQVTQEQGFWSMKIVPEFPEEFSEIRNTVRNGVRIVRYLPVLSQPAKPSENFQLTVLQHGNQKVYLVSSAARIGQITDGTNPELSYRFLTIFDSKGNLLETTLTTPKGAKESKKDTMIHVRGNWSRLCPKQKELSMFGFELPIAKRFSDPMTLTTNSSLKGIDAELREEIFQIQSH